MSLPILNAFLSGAIALGFVAIALFFIGFWQRSRIRLFRLFALAFGMLALERVMLLFAQVQDESRPFVYLIRLGAFLLIIAGIVMQNRRRD